MIEFLENIEFWHWWVLAASLVVFEMFVPSTVLLWPAIGAAIVGLLLLAVDDIGWQVQVLLFAALSVASLIAWRVYARTRLVRSDDQQLNRRAEQFVDRLFTLEKPIVNGRSKIKADGMIWTIAADQDLDSGTRIRVVGTEGVILKVEEE